MGLMTCTMTCVNWCVSGACFGATSFFSTSNDSCASEPVRVPFFAHW